jgi:hypothetical protein
MGKPLASARLQTEFIGLAEQTQGTETSQYLEEKKSKEIPSVAASERGSAQTREFTLWGCRAVHKGRNG